MDLTAATPAPAAASDGPAPVQLARVHGADGCGSRGQPLGALRNVTLLLREGIHAFVGRPSDGAAALIALLAGETRPRIGAVQILGGNPFDDPAVRRRIGVLGHTPCLPSARTVTAALSQIAAIRGVDPGALIGSLTRIGAQALASRPVDSLRRDEARAVELACALAQDAPVLLLFEPFSEVSPIVEPEVRARIAELGRSACVVIATHSPGDVTALADHKYLLDRGELRKDDMTGWRDDGAGELCAWVDADDGACAALVEELAKCPAVWSVRFERISGGRALLRVSAVNVSAASLELVDAIARSSVVLCALDLAAPSLAGLRHFSHERQRALLRRIEIAPAVSAPPPPPPPAAPVDVSTPPPPEGAP